MKVKLEEMEHLKKDALKKDKKVQKRLKQKAKKKNVVNLSLFQMKCQPITM